ncbi:hypothetical protein [Neorhizobium petrolearium]|uniref:hypothetical protein n=1 Tax=Neorhizobium TaxID=1525371 RepID=UPI001D0FC5D3|nr:hypothetical protein [Neorhizobium petrolearium]
MRGDASSCAGRQGRAVRCFEQPKRVPACFVESTSRNVRYNAHRRAWGRRGH